MGTRIVFESCMASLRPRAPAAGVPGGISRTGSSSTKRRDVHEARTPQARQYATGGDGRDCHSPRPPRIVRSVHLAQLSVVRGSGDWLSRGDPDGIWVVLARW